MSIYVVSRSTQGEPSRPVHALGSLAEARRYCNDRWYVELFRVDPAIWKATDGRHEVFVHRVELSGGLP